MTGEFDGLNEHSYDDHDGWILFFMFFGIFCFILALMFLPGLYKCEKCDKYVYTYVDDKNILCKNCSTVIQKRNPAPFR